MQLQHIVWYTPILKNVNQIKLRLSPSYTRIRVPSLWRLYSRNTPTNSPLWLLLNLEKLFDVHGVSVLMAIPEGLC